MIKKRVRSYNWKEEEKQLFRAILREYSHIIDNKSLDTISNTKKNIAWEEVHKKFNRLNKQPRQLSQLKVQWKTMKINALKTCSTDTQDARPTTPNDAEINPAELSDHNIYNSEGIFTGDTCSVILQDLTPLTDAVTDANTCANDNANIENIHVAVPQDSTNLITPTNTNMGPSPAKKNFKRKIMTESGSKFRKDQNEYAISIIKHSKMLKDEEHMLRMKVAEEEHTIKMAIHRGKLKNAEEEHAIKMEIHREKLKSAIIERELLEKSQ